MTATTTAQRGDHVAEVLRRTRFAVDPVLRAAVGTLPTAMRRICGYHLGWWDAQGTETHGGAGKAVRPALVLAAAQAAGAQPDTAMAIHAAAAVELVHNFTLLHDDVMDGDETRRSRPTAWTVFGRPDAILAGDALQALAAKLLAAQHVPQTGEALRRLSDCIIDLCEGQHEDCAFEHRADVTPKQCLTMAEGKTGALLGCACALGALYAGAPTHIVAGFDTFGRRLGLAFQLIDDVLGIWGDPAVTGKPAGADLTAMKKSLPVTVALASKTDAGNQLADLYREGRPIEGDRVAYAADLVEQAGGRAWAQTQAVAYADAAVEHLKTLLPDPDRTADLLALAELITHRDW